MPESYLNEVPIPPDDGKLLADIHVSIHVIQVLELVEVESAMSLQYRLTLSWKDSRVAFRNLKKDTFLNTVGNDDAAKIWYPQVVFYNTKDMEETKVSHDKLANLKYYILYVFLISSIMTNQSLLSIEMAHQQSAHWRKFRMIISIREKKMSSFSLRSIPQISYVNTICGNIPLTCKNVA